MSSLPEVYGQNQDLHTGSRAHSVLLPLSNSAHTHTHTHTHSPTPGTSITKEMKGPETFSPSIPGAPGNPSSPWKGIDSKGGYGVPQPLAGICGQAASPDQHTSPGLGPCSWNFKKMPTGCPAQCQAPTTLSSISSAPMGRCSPWL